MSYCLQLRLVIIGTQNSKIRFFNPIDQKVLLTIDDAHNMKPILSIVICPLADNLVLFSSCYDKQLKFGL